MYVCTVVLEPTTATTHMRNLVGEITWNHLGKMVLMTKNNGRMTAFIDSLYYLLMSQQLSDLIRRFFCASSFLYLLALGSISLSSSESNSIQVQYLLSSSRQLHDYTKFCSLLTKKLIQVILDVSIGSKG